MNLAKYIDHTILKPQTTEEQVKTVCAEAREHGFFSVCVNPCYVSLVKEELEGSETKVCSVISFPLGANIPEVKAFEATKAIADGADEIDMVINIGALKDGKFDYVREDIKAVVEACKGKALLKVIIEACLLTDEEKVKACQLAKEAGADYVKTSTGFSTGGATAEDIALMRKTVGPELGVKASGGVRDFEGAKKMIDAGASRIGASSSVAIVTGGVSDSDY
ncbi:deoxyribose-phosphate aldolase [Fusibacter sp. JL216-2]|uniref:deoxyribose-phosphate aldolase n=1 Tax=Fusibacter sp. JL216-2 TaxID=3071453 RepID=UPI003D339A14